MRLCRPRGDWLTGGRAQVESRLLRGLERDQLAEEVEGMRELLHSWYRSFAFVSRLHNAVASAQQ